MSKLTLLQKEALLRGINQIPVNIVARKITDGDLSLDECIEHSIDSTKIIEIEALLEEVETTIAGGMTAAQIYAEINNDVVDIENIRDYLSNGDIDDEGLLNNTEIDQSLLDKIKTYNKQNFPSENNKVPLIHGTDIFFLGKSESGKSCVLASIFNYAREKGLFIDNRISENGINYKDLIVKELGYGILPDRTSASTESVTYISTNLHKDGEVKPLNFVEMSGEFFENAAVSSDNLDESLDAHGYLSNSNKKLLFFIVDYKMHKDGEKSEGKTQEQAFDSVLNLLNDYEKCLQNTYCIYIIVNKSDLFPKNIGDKNEFAANYFREHFASTYLNLKVKQERYDFELKTLHFSVGEFMFNNSFVQPLNTECPKNVIDSIHFQSSGKKEKGFFQRLFSSKDDM